MSVCIHTWNLLKQEHYSSHFNGDQRIEKYEVYFFCNKCLKIIGRIEQIKLEGATL